MPPLPPVGNKKRREKVRRKGWIVAISFSALLKSNFFRRLTCPLRRDNFKSECNFGFSALDLPPWGPPRPPPRAEPPSPLKSTSSSSTNTHHG